MSSARAAQPDFEVGDEKAKVQSALQIDDMHLLCQCSMYYCRGGIGSYNINVSLP
jgi:hypothetical protein